MSGRPADDAGTNATVEALQAALAGEYACVYAYGLVGARETGPARSRARTALQAHQARRDALRRLLLDRGVTPAPAAPAYDPPFPVDDAVAARRLAAYVENRLALVWSDVVAAASAGGEKAVVTTAARAVQEAAARATTWNGATSAFPGA